MRFSMRLMGKSRLMELISNGVGVVPGAVAALCAELEGACWDYPSSVADMYPKAAISGPSIRIPIGSTHCVDLLVRYSDDMILITFAGATSKAPRPRGARGRRSA
jgi:hypothetical protein